MKDYQRINFHKDKYFTVSISFHNLQQYFKLHRIIYIYISKIELTDSKV